MNFLKNQKFLDAKKRTPSLQRESAFSAMLWCKYLLIVKYRLCCETDFSILNPLTLTGYPRLCKLTALQFLGARMLHRC